MSKALVSPVKRDIELPVWYNPLSPLGSAVRYIASLSPDFAFVGITPVNSTKRKKKVGKVFMGTSAKAHEKWIIEIHTPAPAKARLGKLVIEVDGSLATNRQHCETHVLKVADELGELWPA